MRWCGCSGDAPRGLGCRWLIGLPGVARSMIGGDSLSSRKIGVFLFWETSWYFVKSYKLFCKWLTKGVYSKRQFRYATDTNIIFRRKRIVSNFLNFSQHSSVDENVFWCSFVNAFMRGKYSFGMHYPCSFNECFHY